MLDGIIAGAFNDGRFFKVYGTQVDMAAWASPLDAKPKQLRVSNQNLEAENFVRALEADFREQLRAHFSGKLPENSESVAIAPRA
ncbi:MAG TPA: hypothetical protein VEF76_03230 [Patescibacteria group bacterium]|nr:hypothetical protein [Patescibacteria group bacterium]